MKAEKVMQNICDNLINQNKELKEEWNMK